MLVIRAYNPELAINDRQVTACCKHAGSARWAYRWGLQRRQNEYRETRRSPSAIDLHQELNLLTQTEVPWMYAVSECAPQEALHHLDHAFAHFFRRCKLKQDGRWKGTLGYPPRKTKQEGLGSFRLTGSIAVFSDAIQLHRLGREGQKARECLPTTGTPGIKILSATLS